MWDPSLTKLKNLEDDDAGRLKAFRKRFGRGWDIDAPEEAEADKEEGDGQQTTAEDSLFDLISGYSTKPVVKPKKDGKGDGTSKKTKT